MDSEGVAPGDAGHADKMAPAVKKAKQKTPEQKSALEDVFTGNQHPDESVRNQLAESLGLTIQEVTAWFQNKRRRAKNKAEAAAAAQDRVQFGNGVSLAVNPPSGPASSNPISAGGPIVAQPTPAASHGKSTQSVHVEQSAPPTFSSVQEYTALLQMACHELVGSGGHGPEVSCFFDDPPNAGPTGGSSKRKISEVTAPRKVARKDPQAALQKQLEEEEKRAKKTALKAEREQAKLDVTLKKEQERKMRESAREKLRAEKEMAKHQADEARAEERRQKALAKEQEKQAKAAKRELAKAMREEERRQKLAEKEAMREQAKAIKLQEKMDKKRQRELVKQQKEAEKKRSKTVMSLKLREVDPPDDLEIEMSLLKERALAKIKSEGGDVEELAYSQTLELEINRPPFPPEHITDRLQPAFTGRLAANDCELGGKFLMLWSFIAEFSPVIAFRPISLEHLMEAVQAGSLSEALVNLHIAFIRFIQSEAEIANAIGSVHVGMERMSQTVSRAAGLVSEALSWGLDIASWRAHLNGLTWPEVLRQLALTAGWGPRRCRPARAARAYDDRRLGEDVVEGENGELTFVWPSRFQPSPAPGEHTMKEACWKVLADMAKTEAEVATAAAGLPVREIARRIDTAQLRNNKSATIVEGSVAGALSRDSLFAYVAPGTYALQAVVAYWRKHKDRLDRKARGEEEPQDEVARAAERAAAAEAAAAERAAALERERERKKLEEEEDDDEEEEDEEEIAHEGRVWVEKLLHQEYDTLSVEERVEALSDLLHLALDMPSVHSALDRRFDDVERAKRNIRDKAKEERKVRQLEMAKKAKQDAAEAEARVAALRQKVTNDEDSEMAPTEQLRAPASDAGTSALMSTKQSSVDGDENPSAAAADAAAAKLRTELETAQRNEREASSTAAEAHQRESLGRQLHQIELANAIRDEPIGMDRRFNRYRWYGNIIGTERRLLMDRVLFESGETGELQMLVAFKDIEAIRATLEPKGAREAALARTCDFCAQPMAAALRSGHDSAAAPDPFALREGPEDWPPQVLAQLQERQFARFLRVTTAGMEVLGEDGGVRSTDYLPTDAAAVKKLKTEMLCIESAIPEQAMINPNWDRVSWIKGAQGATDLEELRKLLGALEHNLRKGWLSPTYIREPVLVKKAFNPVGKEVAAVALASQNDCMRLRPADVHPEVNNEPLAWLPATTAALMLRLLCLDAAVCYSTELRPWRERLSTYRYVQNPVLMAGKQTAEAGSIATVCGLPTYTGVGIFPVLPPALVPIEPVPLKLDADALLRVDDEELRSRIPAGLKQSKAQEPGPSTKKTQPKKKAKKRPSDDDDVTRAADIISSDDDFAFDAYSYQYAQAAAGFRDPQETPVESAEDAHDDPNDPEASLSETPDEEEDDADFVG